MEINVKVVELKDNEKTSIFKCVEGNEKQYLEGHLLKYLFLKRKAKYLISDVIKTAIL